MTTPTPAAPAEFKPIRTRNLYPDANVPAGGKPFTLSRSKLEDFVRCPRCFYLDRRLGLRRPGIPAFTLNSAVDTLLRVSSTSTARPARSTRCLPSTA